FFPDWSTTPRKQSNRPQWQRRMLGQSGLNRSRRPLNDSLAPAAGRRAHPQNSLCEPRCTNLDRSDEPWKRRKFAASEVYSGTVSARETFMEFFACLPIIILLLLTASVPRNGGVVCHGGPDRRQVESQSRA